MAKPCFNQFNGGEISPWLGARFDLPKFQYSAKLLKNNIALTEGAVKRRGGSHYVCSVKESDALLLQINPEPANATVVMNGEEQRQLYCAEGDYVNYTVSLDGYQTKSGIHIVAKSETLNILLISNTERKNLTINTVPEDATVFINNIESKSVDLLANTQVEWLAYHAGYESQSGSLVMRENTTLNVSLIMRFTIIPFPADAEVVINGVKTQSVSVTPNTTITWRVSRNGYETKSGTETILETTIKNINLKTQEYNIVQFESGTPGNYKFTVKEDAIFAIEGTGAGSGGYRKTDWNGGSGAVFKGTVVLAKGTYDIAIGAASGSAKPPANGGATVIKKDNVEILTLGGGIHRARAKDFAKISKHFYQELSVIIAQNGTSPDKGNWKTNENALYGAIYGFGGSRNHAGGNGYLKITYKGVYNG